MIWFIPELTMYLNFVKILASILYFQIEAESFSVNKEHIKYFFESDENLDEKVVFVSSKTREKRSIYDVIANPGQMEINLKDERGQISLVLESKRNLISPHYTLVIRGEDETIEKKLEGYPQKNCHFVGSVKDRPDLAVAISNCDGNGVTGIIVEGDSTHYIHPVDVTSRRKREYVDSDRTFNGLHIIRSKSKGRKCAIFDTRSMTASDTVVKLSKFGLPVLEVQSKANKSESNSRLRSIQLLQKFELETAVFVDDEMYIYIQKITNDKDVISTIEDTVFAIMNGVALLYDAPSLKLDIDIVVIHLEIMKKPSKKLDKANGEIMQYLSNFCRWQAEQNFILVDGSLKRVTNIWDHAIMITGIELYDIVPKADEVIGLAWVSGMCRRQYSCTINQGTTFEAVNIITHEMGHNLGMSHDGTAEKGNNCPKHAHIMSASTGPGKVSWSVCSNKEIENFLFTSRHDTSCLTIKRQARKVINLDKNDKLPGQNFNMDEQCHYNYGPKYKPFLSDIPPYDNICRELWCENVTHALQSHPALEGTPCNRGDGMCISGACYIKPSEIDPTSVNRELENEIPTVTPENRRSFGFDSVDPFRNLFSQITDLFRKYLSLRGVERTIELPHWIISNLSECSVSCGGGWQSGIAVCKRNGEIIEEAYCEEDMKPPAKTSCNTLPCFSYN